MQGLRALNPWVNGTELLETYAPWRMKVAPCWLPNAFAGDFWVLDVGYSEYDSDEYECERVLRQSAESVGASPSWTGGYPGSLHGPTRRARDVLWATRDEISRTLLRRSQVNRNQLLLPIWSVLRQPEAFLAT